MAQYPDYETYRKLYKRFYDGRSLDDFIKLAGDIKGKTVLDLCAGDGRLSLAATEKGAKVFLVEKERRMIENTKPWLNIKIVVKIESVEEFLGAKSPLSYFNYVFCQQAVNYWLDGNTAKLVANALLPNGVFVFNTFNKKPSEIPDVRGYVLDGSEFVEVSWIVEDTVHHVQIREGIPPHSTSFKWLSPGYLQSILSPYFSFEVKNEGNSSIYRCQKK